MWKECVPLIVINKDLLAMGSAAQLYSVNQPLGCPLVNLTFILSLTIICGKNTRLFQEEMGNKIEDVTIDWILFAGLKSKPWEKRLKPAFFCKKLKVPKTTSS